MKRLKPVSIGSGALMLSDLQAVQVLQSQLIAEPVLLLPTTARLHQFIWQHSLHQHYNATRFVYLKKILACASLIQ